jgi:hypothetical protein
MMPVHSFKWDYVTNLTGLSESLSNSLNGYSMLSGPAALTGKTKDALG